MLYLLPLTFILWPFSIGFISSQVVGVVLILITTLPKFDFGSLKNIKLPFVATFFYAIFITLLLLAVFFRENDSEIIKFLLYVLMVPFLFFISFMYKDILSKKEGDNDIKKVFYTSVPFVIFCLIEVLSPSFHHFVAPYTMTDGARAVLENDAAGNSFRFLGWTGFLFADYSVALAFTAFGLLLFNKKVTFLSLFIECLCVLLSVVAGRSGFPIVFLYVFFAMTYSFNFFRVSLLFAVSLISASLILITQGAYFFIWLFEPFYRYIEYGSFSSGSVNETYTQFEDFFLILRNLSLEDFLGRGIYFSNNSSYSSLDLAAGDSGIIRMFYAVGFGGLVLYLLIWFSLLLSSLLSCYKSKRGFNKYKLFVIFFIFYGFLFFLKSEWLYQKFFIFILFYFYHKSYDKSKAYA